MNLKAVVSLVFLLTVLAGCIGVNSTSEIDKPVVIVIPEQSSQAIKLAADDLKSDLSQVIKSSLEIHPYDGISALPPATYYYFIGRSSLLAGFKPLNSVKSVFDDMPKARGGIIQKLDLSTPSVVLSGRDVQGTQYMVYDYSEQVLGVDKLAYWTGSVAKSIQDTNQLLAFENQKVAAPVVPLLVYFENDTDELANLKKPYLEYDWQSFTQMIDSLVRLRYNAIEMFDMMGRVEFYTRPEYVAMHPDYQLDEAKLDRMVDYIHAKGMKVQVNMMMGRQLKTLSDEASTCWRDHQQEWLSTWRYYLTETVIKKADIFTLSPRNQVWDRPYESSCGEDKDEVFNDVYAEFGKLLESYKPGATKLCICYDDAAEMFNNNFKPSKDYIIAWPDDGFGRFKTYPNSIKGYRMGTYMHAGFWLNHDVADPYPVVIEDSMRTIFNDYQATHYMMVNGQTFRPFILNLEAFSESARLGTDFDGEAFYQNWAERYFGKTYASHSVNILKQLHKANSNRTGYVEILWQVKKMTAYLANQPLLHPYKPPISVDFAGVKAFIGQTQPRIQALETALFEIDKIKNQVSKNRMFFHDHMILPVQIFHDLLVFNQTLIELSQIKQQLEVTQIEHKQFILKNNARHLLAQAKSQLDTIYQRRLKGDLNPRWSTWYDPAKRRPNNGFPNLQALAEIEKAFNLTM